MKLQPNDEKTLVDPWSHIDTFWGLKDLCDKGCLSIFWAYFGQPDNHVSWVTLMPSASIYSIHPRTGSPQGPIAEILARKYWELVVLKNSKKQHLPKDMQHSVHWCKNSSLLYLVEWGQMGLRNSIHSIKITQ